ncbi:hypothetical protein OQJ35_05600 [Legionella pneumophila]|nr:hypothetical protein [Legionella pneumophila]APF02806.1 hypothetical protein BIZ52_05320 [Legionella pneumophila subsp. fraseri]APF05837.1 hypothetical protein BIZ51_05435 [Legionella pneumophila subsp. fraseri]AUB68296.1 hypothetical protein BJK09_05360 [Legionella pneumophila]AUB71269.1 hypothetical protein BJK08_05355 [Legionella pneumophila]KXB24325.1 hypothetical protein PtVF66_11755 [Legionella pneumophila]
MENWPATVNGRPTGFQTYISYLRPSQVVIGYPSPNANGGSDGSPFTLTATIKWAIQCLNTAIASNTSCGVYTPPRAYGNIGWEVTYDKNTGLMKNSKVKAKNVFNEGV